MLRHLTQRPQGLVSGPQTGSFISVAIFFRDIHPRGSCLRDRSVIGHMTSRSRSHRFLFAGESDRRLPNYRSRNARHRGRRKADGKPRTGRHTPFNELGLFLKSVRPRCARYPILRNVSPTAPQSFVLPMDFSAWFEVYLGDRWWSFDARNNQPRIGRVLMATGRDAADVAITTSFGYSWLNRFLVVSDEVPEAVSEDRTKTAGTTSIPS